MRGGEEKEEDNEGEVDVDGGHPDDLSLFLRE